MCFASQDDNVFDEGLRRLRLDYRCYLDARQKVVTIGWLQKLLKSSPFHMRIVREFAHMVTCPLKDIEVKDWKRSIQKLAVHIWSCWGQTKVVEDTFKNCRYREDKDTVNKSKSVASYYAAMAEMKSITLHRRKEIEVPDKVI